jgi:hypothetical protein
MSRHVNGIITSCAALSVVVAVLASEHAVDARQRSEPGAPIGAARFALTVDGVQIGTFESLISETDPAAGAGSRAFTLTGGRMQGLEMAAWHELVILGDMVGARRGATIVLYDYQGSPVRQYHLTNAWPAKLSLDGNRGQLTAATVMLIYETLRVQAD